MTDLAEHRLPTSVRPTSYDLSLDVDLVETRFDGRVAIALDVHGATRTIVCHAAELAIGAVRGVGGDGRERTGARVATDDDSQRLVV